MNMIGQRPRILKQDTVTILEFGATYDNFEMESLQRLTEMVADVVETAEPPLVLFDLSQTVYVGSDFLGVLIQGWDILKGRTGARLALCGLTPFFAQVLATVQLDRVWDIYSTSDEAVTALLDL